MRFLRALLCVLAGVSAFFFDPSWWIDLRPEALTFLSILLGAVLFRLGRGLPQLAIDRVVVSEVQRIGEAFMVVGDRLVWVFGVTALSILCLLAIEPLLAYGRDSLLVRGATSITLLLSALSLDRAVALVKGDRDLIRQQAELLRRDAWKRDAERSAAVLDEAERRKPFSSPDGYGGLHKE